MSQQGVSNDLASELLLGMRLVGVQYQRIEMSPPFGIHFPQQAGRAQFHFISRGPVLLSTSTGELWPLNSGDAVLLPQGAEHLLLSSPEVPCTDITVFNTVPVCSNISCIQRSADAQMDSRGALIFTGSMEFEIGGMQPLIRAMPELMLISTLIAQYPEVQPMLNAMARESQQQHAGYAGILARLADVVAALIVRGWVEKGCGNTFGWLQALRDPQLSRTLLALHRDPGKNWTVAQLAAEMGSSRSVFAERFLAATGMTPLRYVTELRMQLAVQWLSKDGESIERVAWRLGYGSLAAFSRAFKRIIGQPPGALRRKSALSNRVTQH